MLLLIRRTRRRDEFRLIHAHKGLSSRLVPDARDYVSLV